MMTDGNEIIVSQKELKSFRFTEVLKKKNLATGQASHLGMYEIEIFIRR